MADEVVDTTEAPAEGAEQTEPTEPTEPIEAPAPTYVTAEDLQAALDKQASSTQSWLGRRDKETLNHIGTIIDERLTQQQNQPSPEETSSKLLDNPDAVLREKFAQFQTEASTKEIKHLNSAMETVGGMMEADPLYTDKELGSEVVAEIKNLVQTGKVNSKVSGPDAGKLVLADALGNVMRKRQGQKTNPLSANTPANTAGGITPPVAASKAKVKVPKLDEETARMAKKWGYSDEDLASLYGE